MSGRDFLYFLQNELSQFLYIDGMGNLQTSSAPIPLTFTPDGWQEISILTERNKKYFPGLDRMYGAPQNFVEDGARILKKLFYGKGIEVTVYLLILEQQLYFTDTEYGYYYDQLVKCEVDLSSFEHDGPKVSAAILEGDITRAIKANEGTTYEFDIDVPEAQTVIMNGLSLKESVQAIANQQDPLPASNQRNVIIEWQVTTSEQKSRLGAKDTNDQSTAYADDAAVFASKRNFLTLTIPTEVETIWDVKATIFLPALAPPGWKMFIAWRVFDDTGTLINDPSYVLSTTALNNTLIGAQIFQLTGSKTINVPANCTAYLVAIFADDISHNTGTGAEVIWKFEDTTSTGNVGDPNLRVNYFFKYPQSFVKALPAPYLFKQIVSKLTNGRFSCSSSLLDSLDPYVVFTSGDGIRALSGAKLKTSLVDFYGFITMRWGAGLGVINGVLVMEKRSFWLTDNGVATIDIGEATGMKISVNPDFLFASFKIGCPNQTYDTALGDINGKYEPNMTQTWITPTTRVTTQLDMTTKYRLDMYGQEYERINLDGKTTSDSSADNDVMVLGVLRDTFKVISPITGLPIDTGYHLLDREINAYATGLIDAPSAWNLKLTPKNCLLANGDYLHSCLDKMETKSITLSTADKDVALAVNLPDGTVIDERANVPIYKLPAQIFKPYKLSFSIPDRVNLFSLSQRKKLLVTIPYRQGAIQVGGFTIKTGSQPAINAAQDYELICSADTDLTPFVDIYE